VETENDPAAAANRTGVNRNGTDQNRTDQHGTEATQNDTDQNGIDQLGYEQARDELAEVVRTLEVGGLSLDDALALWERGERLARRCEQQLAGARDRVDAVLREDAPESDDRSADAR
jgi:exodeoxyribonuclease VII small subunit